MSVAQAALPPGEAFNRTQAVLKYFSVPEEAPSGPLLEDLAYRQTPEGLQALLPILDPKGQWKRYTTLERVPGGELGGRSSVHAFQDRDSHWYKDFDLNLAWGPTDQVRGSEFESRLEKARANPPSSPLAGLRIAIDPGHMGGDLWDRRTGKFVHDGRGHKLSEGILALQTALLLEQEFARLGAEVMLTRRGLHAVSTLDYERFDLGDFARTELRESALQGWFLKLLEAGAPGTGLYRAFERSAQVKAMFNSPQARWKYFISRADLDARVEAIKAFNPDITLVIHFDSVDPPGNPNGLNSRDYSRAKVYVPGSFGVEEFASREDRRFLARHLMNPGAFEASRKLGRSVVHSLSKTLGIGFDVTGGGDSFQVEPGVFARNLALSRKLEGHAVTYIECLHYNSPVEFRALSNRPHSMILDGVNFPYSDRLKEVAGAIQVGVVGFLQ